MLRLKKFFSTDANYIENINSYSKTDGIIAVVYYFIFMLSCYGMGRIYIDRKIYLGVICNIMLAALCIGTVILRKQKLKSLGITLKKIKQSAMLGLILGVAMIFFSNILPGLAGGNHFVPISKMLYNLFYYFIIISFVEELAFRGFLQTRIHGLIKNEVLAIFAVALMFSLMHIPFQMAVQGKNILAFITSNLVLLVFTFFYHIIFNLIHRKYNNIAGNTIFHGFMNWGNYLFG